MFSSFVKNYLRQVTYTEVGTYLLLAASKDNLTIEEKVEFIFPICDANGDHVVSKGMSRDRQSFGCAKAKRP